jgi:hypothetical protein
MTDKPAIQRIQELDRERAELFAQAKEEALRRATQAVEDLNALGLKYRLVEGESPAGSKSVARRSKKAKLRKRALLDRRADIPILARSHAEEHYTCQIPGLNCLC